jgi:hypothetical protein
VSMRIAAPSAASTVAALGWSEIAQPTIARE